MMMLFVDRNKAEYEVESVCRQIQVAPSSYYEHKRCERDPDRLPDRIKRDMKLELEIQRVWESNFRVYVVRKVWRRLIREGTRAARCTVGRLMKKSEYKVSGAARNIGQPFRMIRSIGQLTRSTGNLPQPGQINCGLPILPLLQRGRVLFMLLLSLMFTLGILLVGRLVDHYKPT